ncbi:MAG: MATE family efflux transporter [Lachnospiraceae bacterium]|nr:MATE family efflux transporter [Lachnospiraceae bacterium]MBD5482357.1 MATE family efflux transporter [Lachnospiraceae bacterium]
MKDLTQGKPLKLIMQFAVPIMLGNIFQLFYSLADTRIVGSYLGESALASVGVTSSLNSMIIGFLIGVTNGFAIITARGFGAKDEAHVHRAVAGTFVLGIATSVVLTVFSVLFLPAILRILNTGEELMPLAVRYFRIILLGMTASMLYNVCAGLLRAIGDTVAPLVFLMISALLNVGLDILFVREFAFGVEGAAVATVLSQVIAFVASFCYLWRRYPILRVHKAECRLRADTVKELYATGLSVGFMGCFVSIGSVALQGAINSFGEHTIVAHTAARKITEMFMLPFTVFGTTMATYSGQNMGAGRPDRIKKGLMQAIFVVWVWCFFMLLAAYTAGEWLVGAVTATKEKDIIETAALYLRINTPFYAVPTVICLARNAMQGMGDSITPLISSAVELVGKVLAAVVFSGYFGYMAVIWSEPVIWILMVIPLLVKLIGNPLLREKRLT